MTNLYTTKDYRNFIKHWLQANEEGRGLLSKMAQSLNCQNSHLSRLLKEEVHLTPDQAYAATVFMQLTEDETQYFLKLVDYERAGSPALRSRLKKELENLKSDQENLATRLNKTQLGSVEKEMTYYSSWSWSAIHIISDIPKYQTSKAIAERLGLPELFVKESLHRLQSFGLVSAERNGTWKLATGSIHLPKTSPMNSVQHGNWRTRAVADSINPSNGSLHYTIVQTLSRSDFDKIKQILLNAIDNYKAVADKSKSEELACFACDFFIV